MKIKFYKYQGTGNDFILINNLENNILFSKDQIEKLCHRRFGIGADGLMLLSPGNGSFDFNMEYYNSDGNTSSMCGNGGRCIVQFANDLGIIQNSTSFNAPDGLHSAYILNKSIQLGMSDVSEVKIIDVNCLEIQTGSPHYVQFIESGIDYFKKGREIRNLERYQPKGINVNFVKIMENNHIHCTTYERGVEDLTYSCGTGVTAAAIAYHNRFLDKKDGSFEIIVSTDGGVLKIQFDFANDSYSKILLIGPAKKVFEGSFNLN